MAIFKGVVSLTVQALNGRTTSRTYFGSGRLTFLNLEVLRPAADAFGPGIGFELSEIPPKTGLVMILTSRFTNATKSLNSTGLA